MSKVKIAYLQTPSSLPGVFTSMTTLDNVKLPGIVMKLDVSGGLRIAIKNQVAYIPAANIKLALLEEDDSEAIRPQKSPSK